MFNIANVGIKNKESSAFHKKCEKSHSKPGFAYKLKALKGVVSLHLAMLFT